MLNDFNLTGIKRDMYNYMDLKPTHGSAFRIPLDLVAQFTGKSRKLPLNNDYLASVI